jgi:hypothetical protein
MNNFTSKVVRDENNEPRTILFTPIKEVFKFGDAPFLCVANSMGGKSTICYDMIYQFAKEATKIYYVTGTPNDPKDKVLSKIPNLFKRTPTFENIYAIYKEIKSCYEAYSSTLDTLLKLIGKIYPSEDIVAINKVLAKGPKKEFDDQPFTQDDLTAWKYEMCSRLIVSGYEARKNLIRLDEDDLLIIKSFVSQQPKILLIMDDVTSEMESLKFDKTDVIYEGTPKKKKEAYTELLLNMMTAGRHWNCIIALFVHNWNTINMKNNLNNFIILDKTNADGLSSFRSLKTLNAIVNSLKGEIYGYYKYHAIVCKNAENFVGVTKAQLHTDDQFIFDGPTMKAIEIYNNVNSNLSTSFEPPTLGGLDDEGDVSLLDSLV